MPYERRRERDRRPAAPVEEIEGQLEGRNALQEALKSGRTIDKVFIASGETDRGLQRLAAQAKEAGAVVVPVDRRKLDAMRQPTPTRVSSRWWPPTNTVPSTISWRKPPAGARRP